jgi:hypothetical protein
MAQDAIAAAVEPDFGRNDGQGGGLALRTVHGYTSEVNASGQHKRSKRGSWLTLISIEAKIQSLLCRIERSDSIFLESYERWFSLYKNSFN